MNKSGFTLVEVLVVIVIVAVLTSVALPKYGRSIERARATEAMSMVRQIDDSVYAYFVEHQEESSPCPTSFNQLSVSLLPDAGKPKQTSLKFFTYQLDGASGSTIPDTSCKATVASRKDSKYEYYIWRKYTTGQKTEVLCHEKTESAQADQSRLLCQSLDMYKSGVTP